MKCNKMQEIKEITILQSGMNLQQKKASWSSYYILTQNNILVKIISEKYLQDKNFKTLSLMKYLKNFISPSYFYTCFLDTNEGNLISMAVGTLLWGQVSKMFRFVTLPYPSISASRHFLQSVFTLFQCKCCVSELFNC